MTHAEIEEMLGAYALDAVDADERAEIDAHLAGCPRCRAELAAHLEVAAMLGNSAASTTGRLDEPLEAPDYLWGRIAAALEDEPPALAPILRPSRWTRARVLAPLGAVAAALAVAVGLLASQVGSLDHQVGDLRTALGQVGVSQQVSAALLDPSHRTVALTTALGAPGSSARADVVVLPNGDAYFVNRALSSLDARHTFQLWALANGKVVSLGVLGSAPTTVALLLEPTMTRLMITAEPLGGTPVPTTPVVAQANLPPLA